MSTTSRKAGRFGKLTRKSEYAIEEFVHAGWHARRIIRRSGGVSMHTLKHRVMLNNRKGGNMLLVRVGP